MFKTEVNPNLALLQAFIESENLSDFITVTDFMGTLRADYKTSRIYSVNIDGNDRYDTHDKIISNHPETDIINRILEIHDDLEDREKKLKIDIAEYIELTSKSQLWGKMNLLKEMVYGAKDSLANSPYDLVIKNLSELPKEVLLGADAKDFLLDKGNYYNTALIDRARVYNILSGVTTSYYEGSERLLEGLSLEESELVLKKINAQLGTWPIDKVKSILDKQLLTASLPPKNASRAVKV